MKKFLLALILAPVTLVNAQNPLAYPKANKVDTIDNYFGTKVPDPYRWLEDDNSTETANWVKAENKVTNDYLSKIPYREKIKQRLTKMWTYEKQTVPVERGGLHYFLSNNGLQNQSVLYAWNPKGNPELLIDPNFFSKDGTISMSDINVRRDGKYITYNIARAGSDWNEIVTFNINERRGLADTIRGVKFSSAAWKGDGFYYSRYPLYSITDISSKNENNKVFYHFIGTSPATDKLIYEDKNHPNRNYNIVTTEDEQFLVLSGTESTSGNSFAFWNSADEKNPWINVDTTFTNNYDVIDHIGNALLVITNKHAPRNRVVLIDEKKPSESDWKVIIPESKDLLESVSLCGGKIVAKYLMDVSSKLYIFSLEGKKIGEVNLPGLGIVGAFNSNINSDLGYYSFTNYTTPTCVFKYNIKADKSELIFKPNVDFNSDDYESKQVFYKSKDGTKIPMFITYKKGIKMDGNNPCFLYGYGGFNISVTPDFKVTLAALLENGFVYAVPSIRGGGEYGEDWHKAGTLCKKQNVFDDFIGAAEYLIKEKYTSSSKLAIHGRSNGGLLIGAVMTERPDLAKVALPGVGVLDMLRYHKFTIGYYWATDYGRSDSSEQFKCLYKYSPLHNIKEVAYPATMITTADHDDRVVPAHSFKFAATLQEKNKSTAPTLIRVDVKAGHGAGKPTSKQIDEWTDIWSFVFYNLGVTPKY